MKRLIFKSPVIILMILLNSKVDSQSLNSLSGYYNIPSAEIAREGSVTIGTFYIPYQYSREKGFDRDAIAYFGSLAYLPFLEMSLRFTKKLGPNYALGDRMVSLKVKFLQEGKIFPSFAFGAQDFFYTTIDLTNRYNSLYFVFTKNISINNFINNISTTIGYGTDIMKANGYEYVGFFCGTSVSFLKFIQFIGEYDAKDFNIGARITFFDHIFILGGYRDIKYFSGGLGIYLYL